jgi:hemerythrin-like domain-containing protein
MAHDNLTSTTLAELLGHDHERLENLFEKTLDAARAGVDTRTLGEIWTEFETGLVRHMDAEERLLFPLVHDETGEVDRLRDEHRRLRAQLEVLDVEVDLHLVRTPRIEAFVELLRRHAQEEDRGLYTWAEQRIDPEDRAALATWLASRAD